MQVRHRLPGSAALVDADVVTVWPFVPSLQTGLGLVQEGEQRPAFLSIQLKEGAHTAAGKDQGVPRRHRVRIPSDNAVFVACIDTRRRQFAERAVSSSLIWKMTKEAAT
jgi:hypothetical protein